MKLENLKRGMKCTNRAGEISIIDVVNSESGTIKYISDVIGMGIIVMFINDDLTFDNAPDMDIVKVEDITTKGYVTIWERADDKYYLRLPGHLFEDISYLNVCRKTGAYTIDSNEDSGNWRTIFTQAEIDNLPNQLLIRSMEKVVVK